MTGFGCRAGRVLGDNGARRFDPTGQSPVLGWVDPIDPRSQDRDGTTSRFQSPLVSQRVDAPRQAAYDGEPTGRQTGCQLLRNGTTVGSRAARSHYRHSPRVLLGELTP